MILTARRVSAAEGLSLGFVNEVVPQDELLAAARRWADDIAACSPMSIRASKEAVMKGLDESDLAVYGLVVPFHAGCRGLDVGVTDPYSGPAAVQIDELVFFER